MKIKVLLLTSVLALSVLCACGNVKNTTSTEALSNSSGNFSETIYIENPGTDTVIVEMP